MFAFTRLLIAVAILALLGLLAAGGSSSLFAGAVVWSVFLWPVALVLDLVLLAARASAGCPVVPRQ